MIALVPLGTVVGSVFAGPDLCKSGDTIEAHLTVVFAALAVARHL